MSAGTQTQVNVTLVTVRAPSTFSDTLLRDLDLMTWDGWLALPEHDQAVCPRCSRPALARNAVWACSSCAYLWRWPGLIGGD